MKKAKTPSMVTVNRRASFDYHLGEELTVGMVLSGLEVRSIRDHHVQLKGSFVTLRDGELWLNNLTLGADTARNIKLLADTGVTLKLIHLHHQHVDKRIEVGASCINGELYDYGLNL